MVYFIHTQYTFLFNGQRGGGAGRCVHSAWLIVRVWGGFGAARGHLVVRGDAVRDVGRSVPL
jgi:hypothetical protein